MRQDNVRLCIPDRLQLTESAQALSCICPRLQRVSPQVIPLVMGSWQRPPLSAFHRAPPPPQSPTSPYGSKTAGCAHCRFSSANTRTGWSDPTRSPLRLGTSSSSNPLISCLPELQHPCAPLPPQPGTVPQPAWDTGTFRVAAPSPILMRSMAGCA